MGVDGEWKPCFTAGASSRMAILQISTWQSVFIFDVLALRSIRDLDWSPLVDGIFQNPDLLKIGTKLLKNHVL